MASGTTHPGLCSDLTVPNKRGTVPKALSASLGAWAIQSAPTPQREARVGSRFRKVSCPLSLICMPGAGHHRVCDFCWFLFGVDFSCSPLVLLRLGTYLGTGKAAPLLQVVSGLQVDGSAPTAAGSLNRYPQDPSRASVQSLGASSTAQARPATPPRPRLDG